MPGEMRFDARGSTGLFVQSGNLKRIFTEIKVWNRERNRIMAELEKNGISVRQGTHAVHTLGYYKKKYGFNDYDYPMSYIADRLSITLPLYYGMTEEEQLRVITHLKNLLNA